jgi:hypothetical protein
MFTARSAADVCRQVQLGNEARALLREQAPGQFVEALSAAGHFVDAVNFLAAALPKREAVWWACWCARQGYGKTPPAPGVAALAAAEKWAADPSDANRRATQPVAEAAGMDTAAGAAAVAAFFSGGSMAPPDLAAVPPGEYLTAAAAAGAVLLAVTLTEPAKAREQYQRFLKAGLDVANGTNRWKEPTSPAAAARR